MSLAKTQFLSQKDHAKWLLEVVRDDRFKLALTYARAELMDAHELTPEQIAGARKFSDVLLDLPEPVQQAASFPKAPVLHNFDARSTASNNPQQDNKS